MPKDRRKRVGGHEPSVKLVKRQFAVQDNAVEHVDIGGALEQSAVELLADSQDPQDTAPVLKKKEKQQLKREALLERLESSHSPYSKSHSRRLKRKAKEQLAGGDLDAIQMALAAVDDDAEAPELLPPDDSMTEDAPQPKQKKQKPKPGQIGEGKSAPLSKAQRKRALEMEKLRHPLILANPEFSSNPFETIRIHAQNTLLPVTRM
ncbi:ribosome biogenesis protein SLX9-domain-containing protein [Mycena albidolilacea]|uniref:Ribosome biogenesis protein SLX9 n=1 Tax=Mycena albidolilacea TaxID=1033008 RepID=A0AAD7ALL7_9AGAR|nr:ribosome biogenesis protein SLX9-domain-containing protein [Mycena albidolilacea]